MQMCQKTIVLSLALFGLVACQSSGIYVPVIGSGESGANAKGYYTVQSGDTLYSIAFRYGLDYKKLARSNKIAPPYTIFVNQRIRLKGALPKRSAPRQKTIAKSSPQKTKKPVTRKTQAPKLNWQWPVPWGGGVGVFHYWESQQGH